MLDTILIAVVMMLVLGALLGLGLGFADRFLKVEADERVEKVTSMLPGYNCGGCGYPGCSGMAEAMVTKEVQTFMTTTSLDHLTNLPPDLKALVVEAGSISRRQVNI